MKRDREGGGRGMDREGRTESWGRKQRGFFLGGGMGGGDKKEREGLERGRG